MEDVWRPYIGFVLAVLSLVHVSHSFKLMNLPMGKENVLEENESPGERKDIVFSLPLPEKITKLEGSNLVLECEAFGKPAPTIEWLFKDVPIPQGHSRSVYDEAPVYEETAHNRALPMLQLGTTKSRLTLNCLEPSQIGRYTCVASTPRERIDSDVFLEIDPVEEVSNCGVPAISGVPPSIYMWESSRLEFEGVDVQLYCRASGYPAPHVTWEDRNGDVISHRNPGYRLLKNGDLVIKSISWFEHMGQYKCRANNSIGETEETSFLYPTEP